MGCGRTIAGNSNDVQLILTSICAAGFLQIWKWMEMEKWSVLLRVCISFSYIMGVLVRESRQVFNLRFFNG